MTKRLIMLLALVAFPVIILATTSPVGTWKYKVPQAAEEYSTGKLIIEKDSESYRVIVAVNGQELTTQNAQYEGNQLTFTVYVENELVSLNIEVSENSMKGVASYSEGVLDLTAIRE